MTVTATEAARSPAVAQSTVAAGLAVLAAVSLAVGDSWIVDNVEVPITRDLCGGSCTGIESDVSATGPIAIVVLALGLLGIWNAVRGHFTSPRWRTIIAATGVILTTIALSAFAIALVRVGLFGSRLPTGTETCFVGPRGGDCLRPSPASWARPAIGIVFTSAAAAAAVTRR